MNVLSNISRNNTRVIEEVTLNDNEKLVFTKANQKTETASVDTYKVWTVQTEHGSQTLPDYDLTTNWTNYPVDLHNSLKGTGTYIIQIQYFNMFYSAVFSYVEFDSKITSAESEEIPLHTCGSFRRQLADSIVNEGRIYARLIYNNATYPTLQLCSSVAENNAKLTIKFRKMI